MIELLVSLAGKDVNGKSFSAVPGDVVNLGNPSEANMIKNGTAKPVKAVQKAVKK
jgi:hypothetical protein